MNRAERRQLARRQAREGGARMELAAERGEMPLGFWTDTGVYDGGLSAADLPEKVPGEHRWVATAAYVLSEDMVANEEAWQAGRTDRSTMLDSASRFQFAIGCWDCELPFPQIKAGSRCESGPIEVDG